MTIALAQSDIAAASGSGNTITKAYPNNLTAGSTLVCGFSWEGNAAADITSVADGTNGAWTQVNYRGVDGSAGGQCAMFYLPNNAATGKPTVTVTLAGNRTFKNLIILEITGVLAASLDDHQNNSSTSQTFGSTTDGTSAPSVTPTVDNDILIALGASDISTTMAAGTGFTLIQVAAANPRAIMEYKVLSGQNGVAQTAKFTMGSAVKGWTIAALFKPLAGTAYTATLTGSLTPTGAPVKAVAKTLVGGLTPAAVVVKLTGKGLGGTLAPAGTAAKACARVLSGALAPAGAPRKAVAKAFAGGLSPSGALAVGSAYLLTLAGSLTPSGALVKSVGKRVAGTLAPAASLARAVGKRLGGTVVPGGNAAKACAKTVTGSLTPAGTAVKAAAKRLTATLAPAGTIVRASAKSLGGVLTPVGVAGKAVTAHLAGVLTPVGVAAKTVALRLTAAITPSGVVSFLNRVVRLLGFDPPDPHAPGLPATDTASEFTAATVDTGFDDVPPSSRTLRPM